jgi:hypothetical protein
VMVVWLLGLLTKRSRRIADGRCYEGTRFTCFCLGTELQIPTMGIIGVVAANFIPPVTASLTPMAGQDYQQQDSILPQRCSALHCVALCTPRSIADLGRNWPAISMDGGDVPSVQLGEMSDYGSFLHHKLDEFVVCLCQQCVP